MRGARWAAAATLSALVLAAACGDDDSSDATPDTTTTEAAGPVSVTMEDYRYRGLPSTVEAGTTLEVSNSSATEVHELVAVRLPDGETRSVEEILALPMSELGALLAQPATVLLAAPDSTEQIAAVGDGTLAEPGRYVVACFIPTGADPQAYLTAAATSQGPPNVPGGPPHFTQGMAAELTVT